MPQKGYTKVDIKKLEAICRMKPTLADCAAFFECSERTIERSIRSECDLTFVEFRDKNMVHTRHALIRTALNMAIKKENPTMLIFCLKNLCGWKDRNEICDEENTNRNYEPPLSLMRGRDLEKYVDEKTRSKSNKKASKAN